MISFALPQMFVRFPLGRMYFLWKSAVDSICNIDFKIASHCNSTNLNLFFFLSAPVLYGVRKNFIEFHTAMDQQNEKKPSLLNLYTSSQRRLVSYHQLLKALRNESSSPSEISSRTFKFSVKGTNLTRHLNYIRDFCRKSVFEVSMLGVIFTKVNLATNCGS